RVRGYRVLRLGLDGQAGAGGSRGFLRGELPLARRVASPEHHRMAEDSADAPLHAYPSAGFLQRHPGDVTCAVLHVLGPVLALSGCTGHRGTAMALGAAQYCVPQLAPPAWRGN